MLWVKYATHQKAESLRAASLSKLENTVKGKVYVQYKLCWILYKMVSAPSFSQPYFCIQPFLQSPLKICSSTSDKFHLPIQPLRFCKFNFTIPTKTLFLYTSATFHLPTIYTKRLFSNWATKPMHAAPKD